MRFISKFEPDSPSTLPRSCDPAVPLLRPTRRPSSIRTIKEHRQASAQSLHHQHHGWIVDEPARSHTDDHRKSERHHLQRSVEQPAPAHEEAPRRKLPISLTDSSHHHSKNASAESVEVDIGIKNRTTRQFLMITTITIISAPAIQRLSNCTNRNRCTSTFMVSLLIINFFVKRSISNSLLISASFILFE